MKIKTEQCNVLVVDDEPGMTRGVEKILGNFLVNINDTNTTVNFNVKSAINKHEFLSLMETNNFDLVLLDYKMPDVSGLELLEFIIKNNPSTLVIMITAYATFETAVQSTKLGAYDFLAKPFSPEELRNSVKKATLHLILARQARLFEEEKKKIRFEFISVLSHELKAPLNAIEGYINILSQRYDSISKEDYDNMLNRSKIRIDGMRKLIYDMLDLTRIESGEKQRKLESIDITKTLQASMDLFKLDADSRSINIKNSSVNPVHLNADKSEIEIIVNNLISNAIKYNVNNGSVHLKAIKRVGYISIIISDTGIGIAKEDIYRLFNEFSRIKNSQTIHILGSGIGLSTVKKIIGLYNGTIKVRSYVKKGTTFLIKIPVAD